MTRKYDIIIFGASGFTGKYVVETVANTLKSLPSSEKFTWAVSGRSLTKLRDVLREMSVSTGSYQSIQFSVLVQVVNFMNFVSYK
jgi:short subunit dehydrogenase-like uncharacterized protein